MMPKCNEERESKAATLADVLWAFYRMTCHGQIGEDGKACAICGDPYHQAFACRFNGFVRLDVFRRKAQELHAGSTKQDHAKDADHAEMPNAGDG